MNMVGHNHERMQNVMIQDVSIVLDCLDNHIRNGRLAEVKGARAGLIEKMVECDKCSFGEQPVSWKRAMQRQTAVQPPCDENRLF
jgi:hypothetical protein